VQAVQLCVASPIADTTTLPRRQARLNYAALPINGCTSIFHTLYGALLRNGACTFAQTNMHTRPLRALTRAARRPIISPGDV